MINCLINNFNCFKTDFEYNSFIVLFAVFQQIQTFILYSITWLSLKGRIFSFSSRCFQSCLLQIFFLYVVKGNIVEKYYNEYTAQNEQNFLFPHNVLKKVYAASLTNQNVTLKCKIVIIN